MDGGTNVLSQAEKEIEQLFDDGDRALMSADGAELSRIYADDYLQCDESGAMRTRQDMIRELASGELRFIRMTSMGRTIRLFGGFAVVHGSELDEVQQSGRHFLISYAYMDVVVQRDGRWQILASQLSKLD